MKKIIILSWIIKILSIFVVITIHEFSKAFTSFKLGDITPKNDGRITLNPIKHFEPVGFLLMLFWGYGWGKPVKTNSFYYSGNRKRATLLTNTMPIFADILLAFIFSIAIKLSNIVGINLVIVQFFNCIVLYSINIAVFNLIPVYPLCGNKILSVFLSPDKVIKMGQNEKIFQMLLMLLLFMNWLGIVLNPIVQFIYKLLML